jgi:hypothetical protein
MRAVAVQRRLILDGTASVRSFRPLAKSAHSLCWATRSFSAGDDKLDHISVLWVGTKGDPLLRAQSLAATAPSETETGSQSTGRSKASTVVLVVELSAVMRWPLNILFAGRSLPENRRGFRLSLEATPSGPLLLCGSYRLQNPPLSSRNRGSASLQQKGKVERRNDGARGSPSGEPAFYTRWN